jgi:hypothetical protein
MTSASLVKHVVVTFPEVVEVGERFSMLLGRF